MSAGLYSFLFEALKRSMCQPAPCLFRLNAGHCLHSLSYEPLSLITPTSASIVTSPFPTLTPLFFSYKDHMIACINQDNFPVLESSSESLAKSLLPCKLAYSLVLRNRVSLGMYYSTFHTKIKSLSSSNSVSKDRMYVYSYIIYII